MPDIDRQKIGRWGEQKAAHFLAQHGYDIVDRNFELRRGGKKVGEIDIIAWHKKEHFGKTLCFIEVKTRKQDDGSAERATHGKKLTFFLKTAHQYCHERKIDVDTTSIQFEQISVYTNSQDGEPEFRHYIIPVE